MLMWLMSLEMAEQMASTGRVIVDCTTDTDSEESKSTHFEYAQAFASFRIFVVPKCVCLF